MLLYFFNHTNVYQTHLLWALDNTGDTFKIPHSFCICFCFLLLISQFACLKCFPANSGVFSNCLHVFHLVSLSFVCICVELSGICLSAPLCLDAQDRALQGHTWSSDNCFLCDNRETAIHGSIATIMSRGANFLFLPFSMGLCSWCQNWMKKARQTCLFFI